jgi:uroporphyrinogen-III synthase
MSRILSEKTFALFDTPTNRKLVARLAESGLNTILFSPIETEKVNLSTDSINVLQNLTNFDWIIFPDVFSVEFFLQNLEELGIDLFEMDALNVCVFGEGIADKLRFVQLHADLITMKASDNEVFSTLANYLNDEIKELKFILIKEIALDYELTRLLTNQGGLVSEIALYQTKISRRNVFIKLKTLLKGGAADEFIFSADEDLIALRHYFAGESVKDVLAGMKISAVSKSVFQTLKEHDLKPHFFIFNLK